MVDAETNFGKYVRPRVKLNAPLLLWGHQNYDQNSPNGNKPASPFSLGLSVDQPDCMLFKFCWFGGSTTICGAGPWSAAYPCPSWKVITFYISILLTCKRPIKLQHWNNNMSFLYGHTEDHSWNSKKCIFNFNAKPPCKIVSCGFVIKKFEHQNIYYFYFQTIVISPFIYLVNIKSFHFEKIELLHSNFISLNDIHSWRQLW